MTDDERNNVYPHCYGGWVRSWNDAIRNCRFDNTFMEGRRIMDPFLAGYITGVVITTAVSIAIGLIAAWKESRC
jgi:hypothetical protein